MFESTRFPQVKGYAEGKSDRSDAGLPEEIEREHCGRWVSRELTA
jgi:hypothetical protein